MARSSEEILADKILVETGSGIEKNAAERRLLEDQEEYAEAYVRMRERQKRYEEEQDEAAAKKLGMTRSEYRMYNSVLFLCMMGFGICMFTFILTMMFNAYNSMLCLLSFWGMPVFWIVGKIVDKKLGR